MNTHQKKQLATYADKVAIENEKPFQECLDAVTMYEQLSLTAAAYGDRPAVTFQIKSSPTDKGTSLDWNGFKSRVTQAANLFRRLGVGEKDVVAYVLPNCVEACVTLTAGATAGIVNPVNPTLEVEAIAGILRETKAKVVVTLAPFPKSEVNEIVTKAVALAPDVETVLEVDLKTYLSPPTSWIVPLIRPKRVEGGRAKVLDFNAELDKESGDALSFEETGGDRVCTYFHTGGTTGLPKVAQHRHSGVLYNGWLGESCLFTEEDILICPLPMFHCMAAYPVFASCLVSGANMLMVTPAGYRGEGVYENFWKLVERYKVTFIITVPTAAAKLMQQPVNADTSTLKYAISGSAPLPVELFKRFEESTGVTILEGYGMTETTCLISLNPVVGERKVGSVGIPLPYSDVRILSIDGAGNVNKDCDVDEIGEICVANPGVTPGGVYTEPDKNMGLLIDQKYFRTGDLGRLDADGYLWITGRAKDLIIRGGHNIDPAMIEEGLAGHPAIALVGAIGQPDVHAGEIPCAYVELVDGAKCSSEELLKYAGEHIGERAAIPRYIEIVDTLPKTAVGKILKNELRQFAIERIFNEALKKSGIDATVVSVFEDKKLGLVAEVQKNNESISDDMVNGVLGGFTPVWQNVN